MKGIIMDEIGDLTALAVDEINVSRGLDGDISTIDNNVVFL